MIDLSWHKTVQTKSGKTLTLRYIQQDDAARLMDFINPIVDEQTYILLTEKQTLQAEQEYIGTCLSKLIDGEIIKICAIDDNRIVGVCDINRGRYKQHHLGTLGISVHKDYRNEGLGRILMTEAIQQAKDILDLKTVKLSCFAENTPGIHLYTSLGFIEYGRLPAANFHKGQYSDRISMYKNL